jgi:RNA polymerase sigma-70 factor (ECF subfamily)
MDSLATRLYRGEPAAFAELYDVCADRLTHYLLWRLRSADDVKDVLQETFLRLARSRKRFATVNDPVAYVFIVARNEAARWARRAARESAYRAPAAELLFEEAAGDDRDAREMAEVLATALARLDDELSEIVQLKCYGGFTFAEIARITDLPQGTVATRYRRALGRLREMMVREFR